MDLTPYVDTLRRDLLVAAAAGDQHLRDTADRLAASLEPAARLALMEALSHAAAEITTELATDQVDVRLVGREVDFVVTPTGAATQEVPTVPTVAIEQVTDEDGSAARYTLRLPESLKSRAETAAGDAGQSLNSWLIAVIRAATSHEHAGEAPAHGTSSRQSRHRMTGWV